MEESLNIDDDLKLIIAEKEQHSDIIYDKFMETFLKNEPIAVSINSKMEDLKDIYLHVVGKALNEPVSVVAYLGNKCIGGALNYIITDIPNSTENPNLSFKNDFTHEIASFKKINFAARPIIVVIREIERNYGFFIPNCKKLLKLEALFVDSNFSGKGIGTKIVKKVIEIAKKENCDYVMTVASAAGSAQIFKKLGFKCVREISVSSFLSNGKRMLKDFHDGNNTIKLMFYRINN
uniref:N-acetyltransferase domain-containing protein n=1 Tax=Panagrolaimus sp. PS1159 TaxID=55785 RepID=A0AC35F2V9_9BILA